MAHLGDDVSALVDGQLPHERAEAALAHLVNCELCAAQVAVERASRRHLSSACDVRPSPELTDRLMALARDVPEAPQGVRAAAGRAWAPLASGRTRRRLALRSTAVLAGAAGALVVVGTLAERTGDPAAMLARFAGPERHETELVVSADTLTASAGGTTAAALTWLGEHGWAPPVALPEDARITSVTAVEGRSGEEVLELSVVLDGHPVDVLQQQAVLDPDSLTGLSVVDGENVFELPGSGTRLVLQSGDVTVLVSAPDDPALARAVAAAFPATEPGAGMGDRLGRGWHTIVAWTDLLVDAP
ncbi:anti-sigma factor family protein [Georgenia muralis]|uniref:Uncharacterized protein n=1 Tax=Georgenia muralis TaxID=154117 RepID=A0A3N4Z5E9_9MICO|nr:hypothetical protein [Georgenia muralis]RPF27647.1 hypothetical protein EDD32_2136 [Georgenia muralis]